MTQEASSPTEPTTAHEAARLYASLGYRVVPIAPGTKAPKLTQWQTAATDHLDVIDNWWTGAYKGHGVGLLMGHDRLFAVDVDLDPDKGIDGHETLHELEQAYSILPETVTAQTPRGGLHLIFRAPRGVEIHNKQGNELGTGLDIRGIGGQIVAMPTTRADGKAYVWLWGCAPWEREPADAPGWLIGLLTREDQPWSEAHATDHSSHLEVASPSGLLASSSTTTSGGPSPSLSAAMASSSLLGQTRPGDRFNASTTWETLLAADGWTRTRDGHEGEQHWTRPGKSTKDGISATVGYKGSDVLKVFTSSVPTLAQDATYSRFGYWTATRHAGDFEAATRALGAAERADVAAVIGTWGGTRDDPPSLRGGDAPAPGGRSVPSLEKVGLVDVEGTAAVNHPTTWEPVDLAAELAEGIELPKPTILTRTDGTSLIYEGLVNMLYGESGHGKSWVALHAVAQCLLDGENVGYIDLEDHPRSIANRLQLLGVPRQAVINQLTYIRPEIGATTAALDELDVVIDWRNLTLLVIDSLGEAMALQGTKQNDDDAVAVWSRAFARRWAAHGLAVILVDHVPKDPNRPKGWSIGSQRKKSGLDGGMYHIEPIIPFAIGHPGKLKVTCAKDRNGTFAQGEVVAEIAIDGTSQHVAMVVEVPAPRAADGSVERPTWLMEKVSAYLHARPDLDVAARFKNAIVDSLGKNKAATRKAIDLLFAEGYIDVRNEKVGRTWGLACYPLRQFHDLDEVLPRSSDAPGTASDAWVDDIENTSPRSSDAVPTQFPEPREGPLTQFPPPIGGTASAPPDPEPTFDPFD